MLGSTIGQDIYKPCDPRATSTSFWSTTMLTGLNPSVLDFGPSGVAPSQQIDYLSNLNDAQTTAVTAEQDVVIILAGPGSGKTRTLTSRVVDLIVRRKAAVNRLNIGTFHAVCAKILRTRAAKVGLSQGFAILDRTDSENYIKRVLAATDVKHAIEASRDFTKRTPGDYLAFISKGKAKNSNPEREAQLLAQSSKNNWNRNPNAEDPRITVYREYERLLRANNALDFDDLLIYGLKAIQQCPDLAQRMQHVLFQDTNTIQLDITNALCLVHKRLTILYPQHLPVYLEENYRSIPSILTGAHEVISQDKSRVKKKLFTSISGGHTITVHKAKSPEAEAAFVANEIQRLINITEGQVDYGDVSILVRTAYQTRVLEDAFVQKRIPHAIVGGMRFYERAEIKDVLSYLRLVDNPGDASAFERAIQVPPRGIGQASVEKMIEAANSLGITPMEVARRLTKKVSVPGVSRIRIEPLKDFVGVIDELCGMLEDAAMTVDRLMLRLVDKIHFQKHLQTIDAKESTTRWENVEELINTAGSFRATGNLREVEDDEEEEAPAADTEFDETVTPSALLTEYLQSVSLSSDLSETLANAEPTSSQGGTVRPVTKAVICTMHASKGLEWPVVFLFATDQIPHPRSETPEARAEERRLLYVGMTRAQRLLYMTYPEFRFSNWNGTQRCTLSPFADCLFERSGNPKSFNGAPVVSFTQPAHLDETTMAFFGKLRESKPSSMTPEAARQLKVTHVPGSRTAGVKRTASAASLTGPSSSQGGFQSAASLIASAAASSSASATAASSTSAAKGKAKTEGCTQEPRESVDAWSGSAGAMNFSTASAAAKAASTSASTLRFLQMPPFPPLRLKRGAAKKASAPVRATKKTAATPSASAALAAAAAPPMASAPANTAAHQAEPAPLAAPTTTGNPLPPPTAQHPAGAQPIPMPPTLSGAIPMPFLYSQNPQSANQAYAQQMYYAAAMAASSTPGNPYGSAQYPAGYMPYPYGAFAYQGYPPSVANYMVASQMGGTAATPSRPAVVTMNPIGPGAPATAASASMEAASEPANKKARTTGSGQRRRGSR
ncbi:P-loop containing nucleoside triphosphate hydrolase protein [Catenaria anguillulae PL171]|uniref:DNA 3'-5' helicase n=1 Tax=Catenaria anguillulae PL171 TaxID=765915 RepID=A0A1Y2I4I0_9FUNG|nr:P-loop containing nucleoside triphosphate hydrolase protein [Catenaria anguillulae PL171]